MSASKDKCSLRSHNEPENCAQGSNEGAAQNVVITGGIFNSAGRDMHNHFHEATKHEQRHVDVMSALESIDNFRRIQQDNLSKATPKTGEWMFEHGMFPTWRDPNSDVKTLWGTGIREQNSVLLARLGAECWLTLLQPVLARLS
jgi:hypothetical protein